MSEQKKHPNRLLQALVCISLGIHVMLFMHITGIYRSHALSYIELSLADISPPQARDIPRPRMRSKAPKVPDVKKLRIQKQHIPRINIEPMETILPDTLMAGIQAPAMPDSAGFGLPDWDPIESIKFATTSDYFEMVRLRIERCKRYPAAARVKHMEGRTIVRFLISSDGQVSSVEIAQAAGHPLLNTAAIDAVKAAAPFPRPPGDLFKGPLQIEITIMFELT